MVQLNNIPASNRLKQLQVLLNQTKNKLHITQSKPRNNEQALVVTKKELETLKEKLLEKELSLERSLLLLEKYQKNLDTILQIVSNLQENR